MKNLTFDEKIDYVQTIYLLYIRVIKNIKLKVRGFKIIPGFQLYYFSSESLNSKLFEFET